MPIPTLRDRHFGAPEPGRGDAQGVARLAAICLSAESCSMSRIGRASAHTMASRMTVSSLSCWVSPDVDQLVDPEMRHSPSTITILRCMIAPFSDWPMATEFPVMSLAYLASRSFFVHAGGLALIQ